LRFVDTIRVYIIYPLCFIADLSSKQRFVDTIRVYKIYPLCFIADLSSKPAYPTQSTSSYPTQSCGNTYTELQNAGLAPPPYSAGKFAICLQKSWIYFW